MKRIHVANGNFYRRTIGFKPEYVEDAKDHETFSVTGGSFIYPNIELKREHDDLTDGSQCDLRRLNTLLDGGNKTQINTK